MSFTLDIQPKASDEFYLAIDWYEEQSVGLGRRFKEQVMSTLQNIAENPETGSFITKNYSRQLFQYFLM